MSEPQEVGMKRAAPDGSDPEHLAKAPRLDETAPDGVDSRPASLEALLPPVANDVPTDAAHGVAEGPIDVSASVPVPAASAMPASQEQVQPQPAPAADQAGLPQASEQSQQEQEQQQQVPPADQGTAAAAAAAAAAVRVEAEQQEAVATQPAVQQHQPQQEQQQGDRRPQVVSADANRFKMPADAILKQEIPLVRRMASCVIGIKGSTVSKLRRESGAKIHVRPGQAAAELDQVVEIEGSIESVLTCIRLIDELLRAEDPQYKMVPKPEVTCRFSVLPEMIGPAIIGKSGTHAKHIRERTGVRIEVVPPTDGNTSRQQIVLHGAADRTREAYHLLLGNIRKYGPNLPADAVPAPLPFPHRPPPPAAAAATPPAAGYGRGTRYNDRASAGRGAPYGGRGAAAAPPPPPPRAAAARGPYRYDDYGAAADPYARPHDPYAPRAAAPAAPAPAYASAAPAAYPAAAAAADPGAAVAGQPQVMYILQDGVLKPLTVMYQQAGAVAAAAPAAAAPAAQVVTSYAAATGPASTGTGAVVYQQPTAGASYAAYAAPSGGVADAAAGGAAAAAAPAGATWMGAVQQLGGSSVTAAPAGTASASYATAAAPVATYQQQQVAQPAAQQYTTAGGVQYVQYAYPQQ